MKIIRLSVENFKRIRAVEIEPSGAVVQIRGRNEQGKSSVLDSIAAALGGEKLAPKQPVRRGTQGATVRVELDDGMVVERRWTVGGGSSLKITNRDGLRYLEKPQARLDDLIGRLSFDPLAFLRRQPREQADVLRQLSGVDFTLIDGKRRVAYDARTEANREVARIKARLATMVEIDVTPDCPEDLLSVADLVAEQDRRRDQHDRNEARRAALAAARQRYSDVERRVADDRARIKDLEQQLAGARSLLASDEKDLEACRIAGAALRAEVDALVQPDLEEIPASLQKVEATNSLIRMRKAREGELKALAVAESEARRLDGEIAAIDQAKAETLAEAHLPIKGLAFTEEGVTFDGLPLEQASQAQQLRISVAIGSALNPKLRAMLVRDGSVLDRDALALLKAEAGAADLQLWLEQVGKDGEGIVIEDGQVEGAEREVAGG